MNLSIFVMLSFWLISSLYGSIERDSFMGCITFDATGAKNTCLGFIPNDVFVKHIFPHLYQFTKYFAALPYSEGNKYRLINKDWAQIKPSVSDLFYYYHVVSRQWLTVPDQNGNLKFIDNSEANRKILTYLKQWQPDRNFYHLITTYHETISGKTYDEFMVQLVSTSLIHIGIYYWVDFQFLLQERYHAVWFECYELALKKAQEDKRDLKLISDRYEFDLNTYVKKGNYVPQLRNAFIQKKKKFISENSFLNDNNQIDPLCFVTEKEIYFYRIKTNKLLFKYLFNNDNNVRDVIFGSYEEFRNHPIIQNYYQNNKEFMSSIFYEQFKKKYTDGDVFFYSNNFLNNMIKNSTAYYNDFADYIRPVAEPIINNNSFTDEQIWLILYYSMAVFKLKQGDNRDNHCKVIENIPSSFNNQFEECIFSHNNAFQDIRWVKGILNLLRKKQYKDRSEEFYYKLLSFKRKIAYFCKYEKMLLAMVFIGIFWECLFYGVFKFLENNIEEIPIKLFYKMKLCCFSIPAVFFFIPVYVFLQYVV